MSQEISELLPEAGIRRGRSHFVLKWVKALTRKPLGLASAILILLLVLIAVFADVLPPNDPFTQFTGMRIAHPGTTAPNGTVLIFGGDEIGRDLFSRIVHGARVSLFVSIFSIMIGVGFGSILGIVSGYFEGKTDMAVQRCVDAAMAVPTIVLALVLMAVMGNTVVNVVLAIGITQIPRTSRVVRGSVLSVKQNVYIDGARALGASNLRIMARHIFPNITAPIIVIATVDLGSAVLVESTLSFLGLGSPPPTPSWGGMISQAGRVFLLEDPKLLVIPGIALSLAILGFNLAGDALRDIWDPRLRGS
ncbi:MAG: ABC transporter permease [Chloroflexi bacterium]|nr:ABC transporter permease [Chloroflexota bacterium]